MHPSKLILPQSSRVLPVALILGSLTMVQYAFAFIDAGIGVGLSVLGLLVSFGAMSFITLEERVKDALENIALLFIYMMLLSGLPWFLFGSEMLIPGAYSLVLALCFWRLRYKGLSLRDVGLVKRNAPRYALLGGVIGVPMGAIEFLILRPVAPFPDLQYLYLFKVGLQMLVFVGLGEEILFRGIIQRSLEESLGRGVGLVFAAGVFAVMHIVWRSAPEILFVFLAGMILGIMYQRTGSLVGPLALHTVNNTILIGLMPFLI